jgi:hypothetical protein
MNILCGQTAEFLNVKRVVRIFTTVFKGLNRTGEIQSRKCNELPTYNTNSETFPACYIEANYLNTACEQHSCRGDADNEN